MSTHVFDAVVVLWDTI